MSGTISVMLAAVEEMIRPRGPLVEARRITSDLAHATTAQLRNCNPIIAVLAAWVIAAVLINNAVSSL